ncbi:hypothetical protein JCM19053_3736 [Vibrio sp. JCM 19053]|nr:hypothetical protein JCM19053_3736 [Vibrio sp. JCM 19053]
MVNSIPCCLANALNSAFKFDNTSFNAKPCTLTSNLPDSKREISSKSPIKSSAASKALSMCADSFLASLSLATSDSEDANRRAALSGCIKSWLTAAKNRDLDFDSKSERCVASTSCLLSCSNSRVRRRTLSSNVSLASFSACSASRNTVMSVKLITKPPPGIGLPCTSITRPSGRTREEVCRVPCSR